MFLELSGSLKSSFIICDSLDKHTGDTPESLLPQSINITW